MNTNIDLLFFKNQSTQNHIESPRGNIKQKISDYISITSLKKVNFGNIKLDDVDSAVTISDTEWINLLSRIKDEAERNAKISASKVIDDFSNKSKVHQITELLYKKRYRSGPKKTFEFKIVKEQIYKSVQKNNPIKLVITMFPCKIPNRLKTSGNLPDLGDYLSLTRLYEILVAIDHIYQHGSQFIIIFDGLRHKKTTKLPKKLILKYQQELIRFSSYLSVDKFLFYDYLSLEKELGSKLFAKKKRLYKSNYIKYRNQMTMIADALLSDRYKLISKSFKDKKLLNLFESIIYITLPRSKTLSNMPLSEYIQIYSNLFIKQGDYESEKLRKEILLNALQATISYLSELDCGRKIDVVNKNFPDAIRCDIHTVKGRHHIYPVHQGTTLTSFHSVGCIDKKITANVGLKVVLLNKGFCPVSTLYSKKSPVFYLHKSLSKEDFSEIIKRTRTK